MVSCWRKENLLNLTRRHFTELNHTLQDIFGTDKAPVSLFFVPTYPTGMWSFQYGLKVMLILKTSQTNL
jgi:spermidine synthase